MKPKRHAFPTVDECRLFFFFIFSDHESPMISALESQSDFMAEMEVIS